MLDAWRRRLTRDTQLRRIEGLAEFIEPKLSLNTLPAAWVILPEERATPGELVQQVTEEYVVMIANRAPRDKTGSRAANEMRQDILAVRNSIDGWAVYADSENKCSARIQWIAGDIFTVTDDGVVIWQERYQLERTVRAYRKWT